jgi:hypothetical protein
MNARRVISRLAVALLFVAGCTCGGNPSRSAEEFIDKDAPLIVSIPSLGALADHVGALKATAREAGNAAVVEYLAQIAGSRGLGFDPFTRAGQKDAGLDPDRSLTVGGTGRRGGYAAIPYSNLDKLLETLKRLGPARLGANTVETRKIGDVSVTVFTIVAGGTPEFAYVTKDKFLLFAMGDGAADAVAAASTRTAENSAAKTGPFPSAKAKLGARDLYAVVPKVPENAFKFMPSAINAGLSVGGNEIALRAYLPLEASTAAPLAQAIVGGASPLAELPPNQPAYVRGGVDWNSVATTLSKTKVAADAIETLRNAFRTASVDFDKDVLGNLQPGFALSLNVAAGANLASAMDLDPSRTNPFQNYSVIVLGHVKDAAKAKDAFAKLPKAIETFGTTISSREVGGLTVYTASYKLGEGLSWALHGDELIAVGGLSDRLEAVMTTLIKGGVALPKDQFSPHAAEALFGTSGLALAVDLNKLAEVVKGVKTGGGPGGYMVKAVIDNSLKQLEHFRPVLSITPSQDSITIDLATNVK